MMKEDGNFISVCIYTFLLPSSSFFFFLYFIIFLVVCVATLIWLTQSVGFVRMYMNFFSLGVFEVRN